MGRGGGVRESLVHIVCLVVFHLLPSELGSSDQHFQLLQPQTTSRLPKGCFSVAMRERTYRRSIFCKENPGEQHCLCMADLQKKLSERGTTDYITTGEGEM